MKRGEVNCPLGEGGGCYKADTKPRPQGLKGPKVSPVGRDGEGGVVGGVSRWGSQGLVQTWFFKGRPVSMAEGKQHREGGKETGDERKHGCEKEKNSVAEGMNGQ